MATDTQPDPGSVPEGESNAGFLNLSPERTAQAKRIGFHALLWSLIAIVLFPVFWMFIVSVNQTSFEAFVGDPLGWAANANLEGYRDVWFGSDFRYWFRNSLLVSIGATILSIAVCTLGAYSIGRLRYRGRKAVATFLLITQMFPAILIAIPLFLVFRDIGLFNTLTGLVIAYVAFTLPFAIWMLRGFYENLPESLEEAAMIDGSTRFGAVVRVILPLSAPAIATTAIFTWVQAWNEFVFALILINDSQTQTLPPGMSQWVGQYALQWDMLMAGALGATLPMLIVFFLLQSYIVKGLAEGAVKS
ncbi:carbohydrate ABC transporter permease [Halopiger xanaduensis]|uniref:ABC-type transporter, integral membrane subunit n=1 Tax=Halopiger xanaduensis (strain DSM 18323 / JCM 14033 / SH-6) TaxID=797210 RepID=F8DCD1_HALXS|nr:carbohydrate ABC transporter permease [Halopiger xanaduensis]AEH38389.1 ABC-type transporter, integral membrane subunit [Halopiger xanaduensis SH-6]